MITSETMPIKQVNHQKFTFCLCGGPNPGATTAAVPNALAHFLHQGDSRQDEASDRRISQLVLSHSRAAHKQHPAQAIHDILPDAK
jgi:hypothetical protein